MTGKVRRMAAVAPAAAVQVQRLMPRRGRRAGEPVAQVCSHGPALRLNLSAVRAVLGDGALGQQVRLDLLAMGHRLAIDLSAAGPWRARVSRKGIEVGGGELRRQLQELGFVPGRYPVRVDGTRLWLDRPATRTERQAALREIVGDM